MSYSTNRSLLLDQIASLQNQILLTRLFLALFNSAGLIALFFVFQKIVSSNQTSIGDLSGYLETIVAIFSPYLGFVINGFSYPQMRKLRSLRSLLWKITLEGYEQEIIYDR